MDRDVVKLLLVCGIAALVIMIGCVLAVRLLAPYHNHVSVTKTDNTAVPVEVLFIDPEGYTVKRFVDGGYAHYYVTPQGIAVKNYTQQQGKTVVHKQETIQTVK